MEVQLGWLMRSTISYNGQVTITLSLSLVAAPYVLDRLSLLKYRNVRGSHIYIRPSGEHRFTALDDLNTSTRFLCFSVSLAKSRNCRRMVSTRVRWLRR